MNMAAMKKSLHCLGYDVGIILPKVCGDYNRIFFLAHLRF